MAEIYTPLPRRFAKLTLTSQLVHSLLTNPPARSWTDDIPHDAKIILFKQSEGDLALEIWFESTCFHPLPEGVDPPSFEITYKGDIIYIAINPGQYSDERIHVYECPSCSGIIYIDEPGAKTTKEDIEAYLLVLERNNGYCPRCGGSIVWCLELPPSATPLDSPTSDDTP